MPEPAAAAGARRSASLPGVLIVDDALSVRNSLMQLVQDAGFRAEAARDGIDAIDTLRVFRPDIVLTDLEMPNMNGIELTSHIRGRDDLKGLPVIMITSRSQEKHRDLAHRGGRRHLHHQAVQRRRPAADHPRGAGGMSTAR